MAMVQYSRLSTVLLYRDCTFKNAQWCHFKYRQWPQHGHKVSPLIICFYFRQHISLTCRCCFDNIRDFRRIRRYIYFTVAKTIATVIVSSGLDFCNSLYHNIALKDILKLLHVQHCLPTVITRFNCFSHSASLLKPLHRFPVRYHIIFKICAIAFTAHSCNSDIRYLIVNTCIYAYIAYVCTLYTHCIHHCYCTTYYKQCH